MCLHKLLVKKFSSQQALGPFLTEGCSVEPHEKASCMKHVQFPSLSNGTSTLLKPAEKNWVIAECLLLVAYPFLTTSIVEISHIPGIQYMQAARCWFPVAPLVSSNDFMDNTKLKVQTFVRVACRSMVARERLQFGCLKFGWKMPSLKTCDPTSDKSEEIIVTSAEVTPNGGLLREISPNHLVSGLGIIVICPDKFEPWNLTCRILR